MLSSTATSNKLVDKSISALAENTTFVSLLQIHQVGGSRDTSDRSFRGYLQVYRAVVGIKVLQTSANKTKGLLAISIDSDLAERLHSLLGSLRRFLY